MSEFHEEHEHSHDRGHTHEHDHGPDCTCGCHEHDHAHGHEHEHGRRIELDWAEAAIESHVHDQASTVSATIQARPGSDKTFGSLVDALGTVAQRVEAAGAIVGHIKAYAQAGESFAHASATDAQHRPACEGDLQLILGPDTRIQLVAIALLIDLDGLERIVTETLAEL